jgi:integrase
MVGDSMSDCGNTQTIPRWDTLEYRLSFSSPHVTVVKSFSLTDLYNKYGNILWDRGSHKQNVEAFLVEFDRLLGKQKFSIFSQELIDSLGESLRAGGNSNATINRKMAALSKLLRKAYRMGDIHSLPEFRRRKEKAGRIRFLDSVEEQRLFAAIARRSEDYHRLSVFLVDTGCRLGEALALKWQDVQKDRVTFWLTKSGRSRTIPLTSRARAAVITAKPNRTQRGPFAALSAHRYRALWNESKEEIGLGSDKQVVPHILRHTCASRLVQGGIDIRRVQMWLGHQTLQMTMRYAHLATNDLDCCLPILEA